MTYHRSFCSRCKTYSLSILDCSCLVCDTADLNHMLEDNLLERKLPGLLRALEDTKAKAYDMGGGIGRFADPNSDDWEPPF